jgi:hypothetical protein
MRTARCRSLLGLAAAGALTATMVFGAGTASASAADPCSSTSVAVTLQCSQPAATAPEAGATAPVAGAISEGATTAAPRPATKVVVPRAPAVAEQPAAADAGAVAPNSAVANPVASDGTYTNVDGNQVERPDANAAGATAICNDGTYSHSENHSGSCSGHGGVRQFLTGGTTTTSQTSSSTSSGDPFNGQYWDDGQGHHRYGWGWNKARHCWQYAAPQHDTAVTVSQVSSVPTGGVDTGDGSYG